MAGIADLIVEQGRQAAAAREAQGAIWGRLAENLGQIPNQVVAANRSAAELAQQQALTKSRLITEGQQQTLNTGKITDELAARAGRPYLDKLLSSDIYKEDGSIDTAKATPLIEAMPNAPAGLQAQFRDHALAWNKSAAETTAAREKAREAQIAAGTAADTHLGNGAADIQKGGYDPGEAHAFIGHAVLNGAMDKDEGAAAIAQMQQPGGVKTIMDRLAARRPPAKIGIAPEGATPFNEETGKPLPGFAVTPKPPTEAVLDAAAQAIYAKKAAGTALTPEEQANLKAYEDRKRVVSDPAALAATERQTRTITAQTDQQKRAQDFTQLQAARADIEKNVNTPYLTAKASANTLRDVVTAAQNGNKVAGSLQALETTMAAIRAQGLNRINKTETDMTGDAGSMFDRISGYIGKKLEGQPVPADIQKDMLAFSDILENAAYKKYLAGHDASTKLYGVTSLPPSLAAPASTTNAQAPNDIRVGGTFNGKKILKIEPVQ